MFGSVVSPPLLSAGELLSFPLYSLAWPGEGEGGEGRGEVCCCESTALLTTTVTGVTVGTSFVNGNLHYLQLASLMDHYK